MLSGPKPGAETTRLWNTYDAWNRLVKIQNDNAGVPGTTLVTHAYDGMGRRTIKNVSGGTTYHYYYDEKWRVIEIRYNANTAPSEHYVWDIRYIDAPVVRFRAKTTPGTFNETLYYTQDGHFNVTALIDASHVVQERYTYDAYGTPRIWAANWTTSRATSSFANELMFGGARRDAESALYLLRNRFYHPTVGGWLQRDPIRYSDSMNLYESASSNPAAWLDPMGTECEVGIKFRLPNLDIKDGWTPMDEANRKFGTIGTAKFRVTYDVGFKCAKKVKLDLRASLGFDYTVTIEEKLSEKYRDALWMYQHPGDKIPWPDPRPKWSGRKRKVKEEIWVTNLGSVGQVNSWDTTEKNEWDWSKGGQLMVFFDKDTDWTAAFRATHKELKDLHERGEWVVTSIEMKEKDDISIRIWAVVEGQGSTGSCQNDGWFSQEFTFKHSK
jgi:RHS repeat-associated protein